LRGEKSDAHKVRIDAEPGVRHILIEQRNGMPRRDRPGRSGQLQPRHAEISDIVSAHDIPQVRVIFEKLLPSRKHEMKMHSAIYTPKPPMASLGATIKP